MSTLSSANVTDVNFVLKERTHMRLSLNMLNFAHNLGNWLIGKRGLIPISVTADALRAIICSESAISLQWVPVYVKFCVEEAAPNHSFSHKTRLNDHSYGIKVWTDFAFVFFTIQAFDRRTDGQTDRRTDRIPVARLRLHSKQRGKNE